MAKLSRPPSDVAGSSWPGPGLVTDVSGLARDADSGRADGTGPLRAAYACDTQPRMAVMSPSQQSRQDPVCSIERTISIIGDRWTFLVLRESLIFGRTRFAEFVDALTIAPTVLTNRLETLVGAGLLERRPYQEEGSRMRFSYHPTSVGQELLTVLLAIQQWGDAHVAPLGGPTAIRRTVRAGRPVSVGFVDDRGRTVDLTDVAVLPSLRSAAAKKAAKPGRKARHSA